MPDDIRCRSCGIKIPYDCLIWAYEDWLGLPDWDEVVVGYSCPECEFIEVWSEEGQIEHR